MVSRPLPSGWVVMCSQSMATASPILNSPSDMTKQQGGISGPCVGVGVGGSHHDPNIFAADAGYLAAAAAFSLAAYAGHYIAAQLADDLARAFVLLLPKAHGIDQDTETAGGYSLGIALGQILGKVRVAGLLAV